MPIFSEKMRILFRRRSRIFADAPNPNYERLKAIVKDAYMPEADLGGETIHDQQRLAAALDLAIGTIAAAFKDDRLSQRTASKIGALFEIEPEYLMPGKALVELEAELDRLDAEEGPRFDWDALVRQPVTQLRLRVCEDTRKSHETDHSLNSAAMFNRDGGAPLGRKEIPEFNVGRRPALEVDIDYDFAAEIERSDRMLWAIVILEGPSGERIVVHPLEQADGQAPFISPLRMPRGRTLLPAGTERWGWNPGDEAGGGIWRFTLLVSAEEPAPYALTLDQEDSSSGMIGISSLDALACWCKSGLGRRTTVASAVCRVVA